MFELLTGAFKANGFKLAMIAAMAASAWYAYYQLTEAHYQRGYDSAAKEYEQKLRIIERGNVEAIAGINEDLGAAITKAKTADQKALEWFEKWNTEKNKPAQVVTVEKIREVKIPGNCNDLGNDFGRLRESIWQRATGTD